MRILPEAKHPTLALFLLGERIVESCPRNASVGGIGLYVSGRNGCEPETGTTGTLDFCPPGATR